MAKIAAKDIKRYLEDVRRATDRLNRAVEAYEDALNDDRKTRELKKKISK